MPSANLVADPTFQTHATWSSDGTFVDNGDGTFQVDFTGQSGLMNIHLTEPYDLTHNYQVTFGAGGDPRGLHPMLNQGGATGFHVGGSLFAAGTYDQIVGFPSAPHGVLQLRNNAMALPFSVLSGISVIDLDA